VPGKSSSLVLSTSHKLMYMSGEESSLTQEYNMLLLLHMHMDPPCGDSPICVRPLTAASIIPTSAPTPAEGALRPEIAG
jgi:hypothetical protein